MSALSQAHAGTDFITVDQIGGLIQQYGATLNYLNPGIVRRHHQDGSWNYVTDVFATFTAGADEEHILNWTLDLMDAMARHVKTLPSDDPIKKNAGPALAHAIKDCKVYRPHVTGPTAPSPELVR